MKDWIAALRSGKYNQIRNNLHTDQGFCCLGVLCDLKDSSLWKRNIENTFSYVVSYESKVLPFEVRQWAGLSDGVGFELCPKGQSLALLNDDGKTFLEIADIIENKLKELNLMKTLNQAVTDVVQDFVNQAKSFSVHDVTKRVRELVNNFEIDLIGMPASTEGYPCHVDHNAVKNEFNAMFNSGLWTLQKNWNGSHFVYSKGSPTATNVSSPSVSVSPTLSQALRDHAVNYVKAKLAAGVTPSLKQVQSTLKRVAKVKCVDLATLLSGEGFKLEPGANSLEHSKYLVVS